MHKEGLFRKCSNITTVQTYKERFDMDSQVFRDDVPAAAGKLDRQISFSESCSASLQHLRTHDKSTIPRVIWIPYALTLVFLIVGGAPIKEGG